MRRQKMTLTTLYCEDCHSPFTISRKVSRQREAGHVKHMYCAFCKKKTGFIEKDENQGALSFWTNWHKEHEPNKA